RTPAAPLQTFNDDPLRMLRAVRLAAQLGFALAPNLVPAMLQLSGRLASPVVSVERTADELRKMLVSERPRLALELLDAGGLLEVVLPDLAACKGVEQGGYHTHDVFGHTLMALARADVGASAYPETEKLDELAARLATVLSERPTRLAPPVDGEDIMRARGIPPGPEVGRIKERLGELILDGEIEPSREAVLAYLQSHPDF